MLIGQALKEYEGLSRFMQSELATAWLNEHGEGWGQTQLSELVAVAEREGFGQLPAAEVHRVMIQLRDATAEDARRVRRRTGATLHDIQTVNRQRTAEWADLEDFAERYPMSPGDLWLNRCPATGQALGVRDDRHMGVFCQTRGGKGVSFIIPQHCYWQGSLVSIDPSGENATISAARRGDGLDDDGNEICIGLGQQTHVIDPLLAADVPKRYRKRFNPLDALDPDEPKFIEKAAALADALVVRPETENEPVWNNKARTLIKGLILHIKTAPFFKGRRNLVTLRDLATLGDKHTAELTEKATGKKVDPWVALFGAMEENRACGNVIPAVGAEFLNLIAKDIDKQWAGIQSALSDQTEFLESPLIQESLAASDFELSELTDHPDGCSLYLCLPEGDLDTYKGWIRMMIYLIDYEVRKSRGNGATGKPTLMCVDEFAALETMDRIGKGLATIAKYGLQYLLILQNISQLKQAYPKSWQSIMDCLSVKLFASIGDLDTAEWISKRCGETDLVLTGRQESQAVSEQKSTGTTRSVTAGKGGSRTRTDTTGSSTSATEGQNHSISNGSSRTRTFGSSASNTFGTNASYSRGGGTNQSTTAGSSRNESHRPWKIGRSIPETFSLLRDNDTENTNLGTSQSGTSGRSQNWNQTDGHNQSQTSGSNQSESSTGTRTATHGRSSSTTNTQQQSTAYSTGENWNRSETEGESETNTAGRTATQGISESHHMRPLISPDDVMLHFARGQVGDVYDLGLGLLFVDSERPMVVERTAYFVDPAFDGLWCLNPAYPDTRPAPLKRTWDVGFAIENTGPLWDGGRAPMMGRWLKTPGERVEAGEPICEVLPGPTLAGYDDSRLAVRAPVAGVLQSIERGEGDAFEGGVVLGSIGYHLGDQLG